MPIYAYKCSACGFQEDVLQKISDKPLTQCPQCKAESFSKQLTAAGFQLKGSGWYATDFRNGPAKKPADSTKPAANGESASADSGKAESSSPKGDATPAPSDAAPASKPAAEKPASPPAAAT